MAQPNYGTASYTPAPGGVMSVAGVSTTAAGVASPAPQYAAGSYTVQGQPYGAPQAIPTPQITPFSPAAFNAPQIRAQTFQAPAPAAGPPTPGQSLTANLPNPDAVGKQKDGYIRLLDEQLKQGQATLDQQRKQQMEYLHQQAQQQKQQVEMQIKQQVQQQEMQLMQSYNQQLMQVQTAASQQKVALEQQAMQLTMEYQQKKAQEDMMAKQHDLQKQHIEAQMKFATEMQKLQVVAGPGGY